MIHLALYIAETVIFVTSRESYTFPYATAVDPNYATLTVTCEQKFTVKLLLYS